MYTSLKTVLFVAIAAISGKICSAQVELVSNGGFENFSTLPDFQNQLNRSIGWFNPMFESCVHSVDTCASPDYFHLAGSGYASLPDNFFAFVNPHNGSGIAGVIAKNNWGGTEMISTELIQPFITDSRYLLRMYISNGVPNLNGDSGSGWGLDGFGVGFSTTEPVQFHYAMPPTVTTFTIDTVFFSEDWVEYSVIVIADSTYQYLTIGNFKEGENEMVQYYPEQSMFDVAYYFIDDVSVMSLDTANSVYEWQEAVRTFYQTEEQINIGLIEQVRSSTAILYDMSGREVRNTKGIGSSLSLPIGHLSKGIYALRLQTDVGTVSRKVVIP